jgi:hypothetical protein
LKGFFLLALDTKGGVNSLLFCVRDVVYHLVPILGLWTCMNYLCGVMDDDEVVKLFKFVRLIYASVM